MLHAFQARKEKYEALDDLLIGGKYNEMQGPITRYMDQGVYRLDTLIRIENERIVSRTIRP